MCFIRITVAYLCLKMIDFDAMDFSERCSKEVISSFDAQCIFPHVAQQSMGRNEYQVHL